MARDGYDAAGQKLVDQILRVKAEAAAVLNKILDMESGDDPAQESVSPRGIQAAGGRTGFAGKIRRFFPKGRERKEKKDPGERISKAVQDLRSHLEKQLELVQALRVQESHAGIGRHGTSVVRRMRRNAKTALHFADNAIAILSRDESGAGAKSCRVSSVILPVMVEVFDLVDTDTSEKIRALPELARLREILGPVHVHLDLDQQQWDADFFFNMDVIQQVLLNLLLNAFKFRRKNIRLRIDTRGDRVVFSVVDDGKGIPEKDQDRIFKQRFQVKSDGEFPIRGHGIGLAGAQALLERIGGHLELESSPDKATCFSAVIIKQQPREISTGPQSILE